MGIPCLSKGELAKELFARCYFRKKYSPVTSRDSSTVLPAPFSRIFLGDETRPQKCPCKCKSIRNPLLPLPSPSSGFSFFFPLNGIPPRPSSGTIPPPPPFPSAGKRRRRRRRRQSRRGKKRRVREEEYVGAKRRFNPC